MGTVLSPWFTPKAGAVSDLDGLDLAAVAGRRRD
jgi:hypothetical protein